MNTRQEKIDSFKTLLEFLENNECVPLPYIMNGSEIAIYDTAIDAPERLREVIKAFGTCQKEYADDYLKIKKQFPCHTLTTVSCRDKVCQKIVTGTKEVPETVQPAIEEKIIPAHTVEIYEWDCGSLLADTEGGENETN